MAHMWTSTSLVLEFSSPSFLLGEKDMGKCCGFWVLDSQSPSKPSLPQFRYWYLNFVLMMSWKPSWCHGSFLDVLVTFLISCFLMSWLPSWYVWKPSSCSLCSSCLWCAWCLGYLLDVMPLLLMSLAAFLVYFAAFLMFLAVFCVCGWAPELNTNTY